MLDVAGMAASSFAVIPARRESIFLAMVNLQFETGPG
jgi:hypothetical protein